MSNENDRLDEIIARFAKAVNTQTVLIKEIVISLRKDSKAINVATQQNLEVCDALNIIKNSKKIVKNTNQNKVDLIN